MVEYPHAYMPYGKTGMIGSDKESANISITGNRIIYLYLASALLLMLPAVVKAQKPDTLDFYYKLENKADKHKITSWMYDAIFTDMDNVSEEDTTIFVKSNKAKNPFLKYKGKIVRNIQIISLDPFGYSVNDTTQRVSGPEKFGNSFHMTTRRYVIRNLLLFKKNTVLDPLELSESERILRLYPYVNDARIYIKTLSGKKRMGDSVDVLVVVQDKWTSLAGSDFNSARPNIKLIERNIFGFGHQLEEDFIWEKEFDHLGTIGRYTIFNIKNTRVQSSVFYSKLYDLSEIGFALERQFYSPLVKWAGGVEVKHTNGTFIQEIEGDEENVLRYPLNYNTQDIWLAKSFPFTEKKSSSISQRTKSFILGGRYYHVNILDRPSFDVDTLRLNFDQYLYLVNTGFSQRKFYRDRYLYRFGANEDIPEGFLAEYTQGITKREFNSLWYYSGIRVASGRRYPFGYLAGGIGYGTFYNKAFIGLGTINASALYFSNLMKGGKWFFREFTRLQVTHGIDRESYEKINLNVPQMYGFSSETLEGQSKMILSMEFVMYAPYQFIGFKFAPVVLCGLGKTGNGMGEMMDSRLYQSYALGLLIRNEHLISSTFELSIGLYPFIPGDRDYLLKFNPVSNYTLRAPDYLIAKPDLIPYQ
jgi:hypothetical protein